MNRLRQLLLMAALLGTSSWIVADEKPTAKPDDTKKADEEAKKKEQAEAQAAQDNALKDFYKQIENSQKAVAAKATHTQTKEITVKGKNGQGLQTLTADQDGRILALVAPPRGFSAPMKGVTSEIHVITTEGKTADVWTVKFHAHSVNVGPDGVAYVAGDGKVAKFGKDGKQIGDTVELPFIAEQLKDSAKMKEKAEKQVKQQKDAFKQSVSRFQDQLKKLEAKKEEDLTKSEKAQLKNLQQILESFKESEKYYAQMTVESVLEDMLGRVKIINGVAVSEKDLFVVCGETEGYGFAVWRMSLEFKDAKKVLSSVMGCCGQMDIQCCGGDLLVAENTKHRFAKYTRDGKEIAVGGKRGKETEPGCFGGCCNPMNVRACGGDVLTAESEGIVKKFSSTGEFMSIVGAVKIEGGCKNVAIGATKDGKSIFFCDQPGSRVMILTQKDEK